jgi:hypothetical protein
MCLASKWQGDTVVLQSLRELSASIISKTKAVAGAVDELQGEGDRADVVRWSKTLISMHKHSGAVIDVVLLLA